MQKLTKKLYEEMTVSFPMEEDLTILVGENGSGKTNLLKLLKEHWEEEGKEVLYFPAERLFTKKAHTSLWYLFDDKLLTKYNLKKDLMHPAEMEGHYIHSGYYQILNFFGTIMNHLEQVNKEVIVIIDEPERNMQLENQSMLLEDILSMGLVNKLVVATHSPFIIDKNWRDKVINVENCLQR